MVSCGIENDGSPRKNDSVGSNPSNFISVRVGIVSAVREGRRLRMVRYDNYRQNTFWGGVGFMYTSSTNKQSRLGLSI